MFAYHFGLAFVLYAKNTQNYREYRVTYATVYLNEAANGHSMPVKRGVNFVMVGRTDLSNSDNQNCDGGGLVCAFARVCVRVCARACMRACVRDVFAKNDNNISPRLIMIIIKIIFLYFIEIAHTDDVPLTDTRLVRLIVPMEKKTTNVLLLQLMLLLSPMLAL